MNIWDATVDDGKFACSVTRTGEYAGQLLVTHTESKDVVLSEGVHLAYAARFGPDVDDVSTWEMKSIAAIDAWIEAHP